MANPSVNTIVPACAHEMGISKNADNIKLPNIDRNVILLPDKGIVMSGQAATIAVDIRCRLALWASVKIIVFKVVTPKVNAY